MAFMESIWRKRRKGEKFCPKERYMIANVFNYFNKSMNVSSAAPEQSKAFCCLERAI